MPNCIDDLLEYSGHALTREEATAIMDGVMRAYRKTASMHSAEVQLRRATREFVPADDADRALGRAITEGYQPRPFTPEQRAEQSLSPRDDGDRPVTMSPPDLKGVKTPNNKRRFLKNAQPKSEGDAEALIDAAGLPDESPKTSAEAWNEAAIKAHEEATANKAEALRRLQLQLDAQMNLSTERARLGGDATAGMKLLTDSNGSRTLWGRIRAIQDGMFTGLKGALQEVAADPEVKGMDPIERDVALVQAVMDQGNSGRPRNAFERLAFAFRTMEDSAFNRKNAGGAVIKYVKGHLPQAWDSKAVRLFGLTPAEKAKLSLTRDRATRDRYYRKAQGLWIDYNRSRIDPERYTNNDGSAVDLDEMLATAWKTLASDGNSSGVAEMGTSSLAQRLGKSRELWYKDARSYVEANRAFGSRDVFTAMTADIGRHAREIALLEMFGPNPASGFKQMVAEITEHQATQNPGNAKKGTFALESVWAELNGQGSAVPEGSGAFDAPNRFDVTARVFRGARNMIASAKLGMLPFAQIQDLATFRVMARSHGLGTGDTLKAIGAMFSGENRAKAERYGLLMQTITNDAALRFGGDTGAGDSLTAQLANATVKYSGAQLWTDSLKQAAKLDLSWHLADAKGTAWGDLDPRFKSLLDRYAIDESDWEILRDSKTVTIAGRESVTPTTIRQHIPKAARAIDADMTLARKAEQQTLDLSEKVGALMAEEADLFVLTPGPKERAFLLEQTRSGTIWGEVARSMIFFKTFSVAMLTKLYPRLAQAEGKGWGGPAGLVTEFAILSMLAGGVTVQLKEAAKGRDPKEIDDGAFWMAAFLQGGGLGIFGDFAFKEQNRFGGGLIETLAGPVGSLAGEAHRLTVGNANEAARGDDTHLAAESMQFVKNNAPLVNLWYTRLALDHLIFLRIQEAANPGYRRRMQDRTERDGGHWWFPPTQSTPDHAPDLSRMTGGN